MLVKINDTLVNLDNVCFMERRYQITNKPDEPEMRDNFRISITFVNDKTISVEFKDKRDLDLTYELLNQSATVICNQ